jgi:PTS system maltose and glucose-specific IIC component
MLPLGAVMFCLYYFSFRFLIKWRQLKTPGREDEADDETRLHRSVAMSAREDRAGAGRRDNIVDVDCCATRLRITVKNPQSVLVDAFKQLGSRGAFIRGEGCRWSTAACDPD